MLDTSRFDAAEPLFGLTEAMRLIGEACAPWLQELGLRVEAVEANRPAAAPADWQPGTLVRLPLSRRICRADGVVCAQALMALADASMLVACAAAWNGYRPMRAIDQTTHFLRPVAFDVVSDARVVRIDQTTSFGRAMLYSALDKRPAGMVASAYVFE